MTPTNSPYDSDSDATAELLRQALSAEAADVQPSPDALRSIQQRTGAVPSADSSGRARRFPAGANRTNLGGRPSWWLGALGAAAATAAVITAVVVIGDQGTDPSRTPAAGPGTTASQTGVTTEPTDDSPATGEVAPMVTVPVTYVGLPAASRASRLYTEQQPVSSAQNRAVAAVEKFLCCQPPDPDYTTGWPEGLDVSRVSSAAGVTKIDLVGPADGAQFTPDPRLGADGGSLALQALFRTAGLRPGDEGTITYNGDPVMVILGVDMPVTVKADDEVRALISIDNIVDGDEVWNPVTVKVSGNVFEGTVNWELLNAKGSKVDEGFVTTSMGMWTQTNIRLGTLEPGTYTIRCLEYSAEDGSPGHVDDKTFTVR